MHRFRVWGLSAALAAGVGGQLAAADPPAKPADDRPWYKKMLGTNPAAAPKPAGPVARSGPVMPGRPPVVAAPLPPEVVADALKAEQDAFLRRLSVCSQLRQVGLETNNDSLVRQADELERQATALYNARTAALGVPKVKAPLPETASLYGDPADPKAAAARLAPPAAPAPATASTLPIGGDVREVKP